MASLPLEEPLSFIGTSFIIFTCAVTQAWHLGGLMLGAQCSAIAILKFLVIFEHWAPHFHFALGPANGAACPALMLWFPPVCSFSLQ